MAAQAITRDEIEDIVVGNAIKHPQYRDALLKNPKKVIETQLNNKLPDGLNVKVVQETGDTIYLRLPHKISEGSELSDTDLEQVAGGKGFGSEVSDFDVLLVVQPEALQTYRTTFANDESWWGFD